jgi:hypothetical protein
MKTFVIVLVLLAILFAVGVVLGAARSDEPKKAETHEPGGFERALDGLFRSMKPRARLSAASFPCGTSTSVPAAKDETRTLKLKLSPGCRATITYTRAPAKTPSDLDVQRWPEEEAKDKTATSFVIFKEGGSLVFGPCDIQGHAGCRAFVVED